jgi:DNA-3-methyladenine glycosylase II
MQRISLTDENLDYGAQQLAAVDADLGRIYTRLGTPPLWAREPGFASLVHIILEQQISIKAAQTVFERLCAHLCEMSPQRMVSAGEEELKAFGLTRQKARYCFGLAERIHTGKLNLAQLDALSDTEGRNALLAVPGLGPWSVDVYYLMALRRPDVWPLGDLALAAAMQDIKQLDAPATRQQQVDITNAWSPWRAVAARLLWMHYLDSR